MTITKGVIKENRHRKDIYIVTAVGIMFILSFSGANMQLSVYGQPITAYAVLAPIVLGVLGFLAAAFSIIVSLGTIPNEYKRGTSHLVWVRAISQPRYHGGLMLGSVLSSLATLAALYAGFAGFLFLKGGAGDLIRLPMAFMLSCLPVIALSVLASVASIKLPAMAAGLLSFAVLIAGTAHPLLSTLANTLGGFGGSALRVALNILPNLYTLHAQASNLLFGRALDIHSLMGGLLMIYGLAHLLFVLKKKEA